LRAYPLFVGNSASLRAPVEVEVLIPTLYLKRISTGDFEDALIALLGRDAAELSASTIGGWVRRARALKQM
jgi:hypothetical protein